MSVEAAIDDVERALAGEGYLADRGARHLGLPRAASSSSRCCSRARPASARPRSPARSPRRTGTPDPAAVPRGHRPPPRASTTGTTRASCSRSAPRRPAAPPRRSSRASSCCARPLLEALEHDGPVVLLIDEVDRADDEFEAFLLEFLSDFAITIPELGTIAAHERPLVVLTSNRTRELHDALKRRCLYHWIDYPTRCARPRSCGRGCRASPTRSRPASPRRSPACAAQELYKLPGVGETISWARALIALGEDTDLEDTLGVALKVREDIARVREGGVLARCLRSPRARLAHGFAARGRDARRRRAGRGRRAARRPPCAGGDRARPPRRRPTTRCAPCCARPTATSRSSTPRSRCVFARADPTDGREAAPGRDGQSRKPCRRRAGCPTARRGASRRAPCRRSRPPGARSSSCARRTSRSTPTRSAPPPAACSRAGGARAAAARSRRTRPTRKRGDIHDLRATVRASLRHGGELVERRYRAPRLRARRLVLVCDISGSMAPYARMLLQYVQACVAARRRVEAFAFGTRLTRVTRELAGRDPDRALARASEAVHDWSGGTRIGAASASSIASTAAASAAARSSSCSRTAGTAATRSCSRPRWRACSAARTASCG